MVAVAFGVGRACAEGPVRPLANDFVTVYESPDAETIFCYTPGLERLADGRLVATLDLGGPGVRNLPGPKTPGKGPAAQGKIFTSDDHGRTWTHRADFPFMHARPFVAGRGLYVLGHAGDLTIIRSDDRGVTWSAPVRLSQGQAWHQSACNVLHAHGAVYLVMERLVYNDVRGWPVSALAPVLMRANEDADLTRRESWTLASELVFRDACAAEKLDGFGIPFFATNASMVIDGRDLQILSRSGDERAHSAHDGNRITLHTVRDFRGLIY